MPSIDVDIISHAPSDPVMRCIHRDYQQDCPFADLLASVCNILDTRPEQAIVFKANEDNVLEATEIAPGLTLEEAGILDGSVLCLKWHGATASSCERLYDVYGRSEDNQVQSLLHASHLEFGSLEERIPIVAAKRPFSPLISNDDWTNAMAVIDTYEAKKNNTAPPALPPVKPWVVSDIPGTIMKFRDEEMHSGFTAVDRWGYHPYEPINDGFDLEMAAEGSEDRVLSYATLVAHKTMLTSWHDANKGRAPPLDDVKQLIADQWSNCPNESFELLMHAHSLGMKFDSTKYADPVEGILDKDGTLLIARVLMVAWHDGVVPSLDDFKMLDRNFDDHENLNYMDLTAMARFAAHKKPLDVTDPDLQLADMGTTQLAYVLASVESLFKAEDAPRAKLVCVLRAVEGAEWCPEDVLDHVRVAVYALAGDPYGLPAFLERVGNNAFAATVLPAVYERGLVKPDIAHYDAADPSSRKLVASLLFEYGGPLPIHRLTLEHPEVAQAGLNFRRLHMAAVKDVEQDAGCFELFEVIMSRMVPRLFVLEYVASQKPKLSE